MGKIKTNPQILRNLKQNDFDLVIISLEINPTIKLREVHKDRWGAHCTPLLTVQAKIPMK